jgi:hypothetical protein
MDICSGRVATDCAWTIFLAEHGTAGENPYKNPKEHKTPSNGKELAFKPVQRFAHITRWSFRKIRFRNIARTFPPDPAKQIADGLARAVAIAFWYPDATREKTWVKPAGIVASHYRDGVERLCTIEFAKTCELEGRTRAIYLVNN